MTNVSGKNGREYQNTHFMFNNFFFENRAVCMIMWKNILQSGRPFMTIWRMHIACWIPKPTNAQSEYVAFIDFPLQQRLHEHASLLRKTYMASLFFLRLVIL
jgi:hypothetical protein